MNISNKFYFRSFRLQKHLHSREFAFFRTCIPEFRCLLYELAAELDEHMGARFCVQVIAAEKIIEDFGLRLEGNACGSKRWTYGELQSSSCWHCLPHFMPSSMVHTNSFGRWTFMSGFQSLGISTSQVKVHQQDCIQL